MGWRIEPEAVMPRDCGSAKGRQSGERDAWRTGTGSGADTLAVSASAQAESPYSVSVRPAHLARPHRAGDVGFRPFHPRVSRPGQSDPPLVRPSGATRSRQESGPEAVGTTGRWRSAPWSGCRNRPSGSAVGQCHRGSSSLWPRRGRAGTARVPSISSVDLGVVHGLLGSLAGQLGGASMTLGESFYIE